MVSSAVTEEKSRLAKSPSYEELVKRRDKMLAPIFSQDWPNLPVVKAQGLYLYGLDGKRYMDFMAAFGVVNVGHNHPRVVTAAREQMERQIHGAVGVTLHESVLRLAYMLPEILPGNLDMFFFGNSGSEAVEGAIKLARNVTRRPGIIAFMGAFHGRTYGAASLTASKAIYRTGLDPFLPSIYHVPYADPYHSSHPDNPTLCVEESLAELQILLKRIIAPSQVAAVIVEPIQGEGGYIVPPKEFLKRLREICTSNGMLLIFDEVQSGFGRTGEWFAAQAFDITPDVMAIAKGIASGFPLGAVCARSELMSRWEPTVHGTTFGGNPVSCAAAVATIDTIRDEGLLQNAKKSGEYLLSRLKELKAKHKMIGDARGLGLMTAIEFIVPGTDREPNSAAAKKFLNECLSRGLLMYPCGLYGHVVRLAPPLNVTRQQIDEAMSIADQSLSVV
ncbi:MAG: aspartate aminotransferase family protein [Candidatus Bathyarchaeia archaeon]